MNDNENKLPLNPERLIRILFGIAAVLLLLLAVLTALPLRLSPWTTE